MAFWPDIPLVLGVALPEADPSAEAVEPAVEAAADAVDGPAGAEDAPADADVARDVEVRDAGVGDAELFAMGDVVAVEGAKVAIARGSTEAVKLAGAAETAVATWLALVACAATLPIDEMDWAAGAAAACITKKPSATAAVVTVLRRGKVRETGISRIPPINRPA